MTDSDDAIRIRRTRSSLDLATIVGLVSGFGLIVSAIILGGSPGSFVNIPGVLIVIGGTFAVTTICFSPIEIARTAKVLSKTVFHRAACKIPAQGC